MRLPRAFVICLSVLSGLGGFAQQVNACAVCFGRSDAPLAKGMNMGIFSLLLVVLLMWVAFGLFFVHLARRSSAIARRTGHVRVSETSNSCSK